VKPIVTPETTLRELGEILESRSAWLERAEVVGFGPNTWRVEYVEEPHYVTARGATIADAIAKAMAIADQRRGEDVAKAGAR
jgi:hypothetical protein